MRTNVRGLVGGFAVGAAAVGLFLTGLHLSPESHPGTNLLGREALALGPTRSSDGLLTSAESGAAGAGDQLGLSAGHGQLGLGPSSGERVAQADGDTDPQTSALGPGDGPGATFQQVYFLLKKYYVEGVPADSVMAHGAASAMLASLQDPSSRFLDDKALDEARSEAKGIYHGIGAATAIRVLHHPKDATIEAYNDYHLTIVAVPEGSPAAKAGLRPGDVITDIDGHWVIGTEDPGKSQAVALKAAEKDPVAYNKLYEAIIKKVENGLVPTEAQLRLNTEKTTDKTADAPKPADATKPDDAAKPDNSAKPTDDAKPADANDPSSHMLALNVIRPGSPKPLTINVDTRGESTLTPVVGRSLQGGIGYIKINQFTPDADKLFADALGKYGADVKGLVLDLRDNPGGLVDVAAAVTGQLSPEPSIGFLRTKDKNDRPITVPERKGVAYPVVVLVDGNTSNAAELVASALQLHGSQLVGATTFGDATADRTVPLRDGSGFTMTVGRLFTARHMDFQSVGIKPDIAVPATDPDGSLNRSLSILSGRVAGLPISRG